VVDVTDLPQNVAERAVMLVTESGEPAGAAEAGEGYVKIKLGTPVAEVEHRLLEETLRITRGNKTLAAKMLGIDPKTVFRWLKEAEEGPGAEAAAER
jgi:DNA-binding NtrC family response regulator